MSKSSDDPLDLLKNKKQVLKALVKLGWQCIHPSKEEDSRPSHMQFRLNRDPKPVGQNSLYTLSVEASRTFDEVKELLKKEPNVKRIKRRIGKKEEMHDEVRDYCRTIINCKERIKSKNDVKFRAQEYLSSLVLPETQWLVVSPISGLSLENERIPISDSDIMKFNLAHVTKYSDKVINQNSQRQLTQYCNEKVCVLVCVKAIDSNGAIEKGEKKINHILCTVRGYFGTYTFFVLPTPSVFFAINKDTGEVRTLTRYSIESKCHIDLENEKKLLNQISDLSNFLNGKMPAKIKKEVLRALRWLGSSVQDKEFEDKLIKCFFALETLLTPGKGDQHKGQPLVFRLALLELRVMDDYYENPDPLYQLYKKRSTIVHGGDIDEDPITKEDMRYLEFRTWKAILYVSNVVVNTHGGEISDTKRLVSWIERQDDQVEEVKKFISEYCEKELEDYVNSRGKS